MSLAKLISDAIKILEKNISQITASDSATPAARAKDEKSSGILLTHLRTLSAKHNIDDAALAQSILDYKNNTSANEQFVFDVLKNTAEAVKDPSKKISSRGKISQLNVAESLNKELLDELRSSATDYIQTLKKPTPIAEAKKSVTSAPATGAPKTDKPQSAVQQKFGALMATLSGKQSSVPAAAKSPTPPTPAPNNRFNADKKTVTTTTNPSATTGSKTSLPPLPPTPRTALQENKEVEQLKFQIAELKKKLADKEKEAEENHTHATEHYQYQWSRAEEAERQRDELHEEITRVSLELPVYGEYILPHDLVAPNAEDLNALVNIITHDLILQYHYAFALIVLFPDNKLEEIEKNIEAFTRQKSLAKLNDDKASPADEKSTSLKEGEFITGVYHIAQWRIATYLEKGELPVYPMGATEFRNYVASSNRYIAAKDNKNENGCPQQALLQLQKGEPEYLQKKIAAAFFLKVLHNMELCSVGSSNAMLITKYKNFLIRNFPRLRLLAQKKFEALPHTVNDMHAELKRLLKESQEYADKLLMERIATKMPPADLKGTNNESALLQAPPSSITATIFSPVKNVIALFNFWGSSSTATQPVHKVNPPTQASTTPTPAPTPK